MAAAARTYNQDHIARKFTRGKRRMSIYWTWSYPWESQRDLAEMDNRFSTMTEVRRVAWPNYETPEWSAAQFLQGIAGTLELFHRSTLSFQRIAGEPLCSSRSGRSQFDRGDFSAVDMRIISGRAAQSRAEVGHPGPRPKYCALRERIVCRKAAVMVLVVRPQVA